MLRAHSTLSKRRLGLVDSISFNHRHCGCNYFFFPRDDKTAFDNEHEGGEEHGYYRYYYNKSEEEDYDYYCYPLVLESQGAIVRSMFVTMFYCFLAVCSSGRRLKVRQRIYLRNDRKYFPKESQTGRGHYVEDTRQAACAHTLCGCYPVDPPYTLDDDEEDERITDDICQECLRAGLTCCFGKTCRPFGWMQLFGCCALAQEAREMKHLLPSWKKHVDYITHQPFVEYSDGREETYLSKLSMWLGATFFCSLVVIVEISLIDTNSGFTLEHALALLATFGESFLMLLIVHCVYCKSYLSLDGIVNFFSAGFKFSSQGRNFNSIGVGAIVSPAIWVHGSFDAVLMVVSLFAEHPIANDGSIINVQLLGQVAWVGAFCFMVMGIFWYIVQSRKQKTRLRLMEEKLVLSYYRQHEEKQQQYTEMGTTSSPARSRTYESPKIRPSLFDYTTSSSAMPHSPGGMSLAYPSDEGSI